MSLHNLTVLSALALALGCRSAPSPEKPSDDATPDAPGQGAQATPDSPNQQGISVHGHWTIEVRRPDGTVAKNEFDNDYTAADPTTARILAGERTAGQWLIVLADLAAGTGACLDGVGGTASYCSLANGGPDFFDGVDVHKTLMVTAGMGTVTLAGSVPIAQATSIDHVQSILTTCDAAIESAAACRGGETPTATSDYSTRSLGVGEAIAVEPGDIVSVRVDYTYAAGS